LNVSHPPEAQMFSSILSGRAQQVAPWAGYGYFHLVPFFLAILVLVAYQNLLFAAFSFGVQFLALMTLGQKAIHRCP